MTTRTSRRSLLVGAVSGCVLAALPAVRGHNELLGRIRRVLSRSARAHADEVERAGEIVFGSAHAQMPIESLSDAQIVERVRSNITADYRAGRLVDLQGWRIAATESHALALLRPGLRA
jgi:hypothetical protein